MIEGLGIEQMPSAIEALLFVTDEPVSALSLSSMLEAGINDVEAALKELQVDLIERDSGIQLLEVAGGWRLATHPRYHELIERYVLSWDTRKLSQAALETLAIVAYTQPVTRAQVSSIRGVSSDSSLNSLVEKGLVREAGTADAPGNPTLYATTKAFLERFGLNSVKDLTDISEFAPDEETKRLIAERLSSTKDNLIISDDEARRLASDMIEDAADALLDGQKMPSGQSDGIIGQGNDNDIDPDRTSEMFREALASTLGVVDKIDFDELDFDISDE